MKSLLPILALCALSASAYAVPNSVSSTESGSPKRSSNRVKKKVQRSAKSVSEPESTSEDLSNNTSNSTFEAADAWGTPASAKPTQSSVFDAPPPANMAPTWNASLGPQSRPAFPWLEHHGYLRVRGDLFHNLSLGTWSSDTGGSSPVLPPLTETSSSGPGHPENQNAEFKTDGKSLASANMRFRYQPTFHVSESLRVHATFDILDNVVLGSTPEIGILSADGIATEHFANGQAGSNAITVRHAWGEWQTPVGHLAFGRMPAHWGLGLLYNSGSGIDADFGDAIDRVVGTVNLFNTYLSLSWDFPNEGVVGYSGRFADQATSSGQAYDYDQRDDVTVLTVSLFQKPLTREEKERRFHQLHVERKLGFDWGAYGIFYNHDLMSEGEGTSARLRDVEAEVFIPDLWLNFEYAPSEKKHFRLGFEAVAAFGKMKEVPQRASEQNQVCYETGLETDTCPGGDTYNPRRRDVTQWGYALEFDAQINKFRFGFHHGTASGDTTKGFGVLDQTPFDTAESDKDLTAFTFDRAYTVDLILFRELIGAVTNASYFKPYMGYDFIHQDDEAWGFTLSGLYAFAVEPKATPGEKRPLGLEFDAEVFIEEFNRFRWSIAYGLLLPFSGFNVIDESTGSVLAEPEIAQTLQMNLTLSF